MTREEAIEKIKSWDFLDDNEKEVLETFIPELRESDDERIRKALMWFLEHFPYERLNNDGVSAKEALAWLEKQSKQKNSYKITFEDVLALECAMKTVKRTEGGNELYEMLVRLYNKIHNAYLVEKQGEQAVIPHKFNVGDWIVSKWGEIYQIKEVMSGSYNLLCPNNAEEINSITQVDNNSRLLCISDIKKLEEQSKKKNVDVESLSKTILASHGDPFEKPKWIEEDSKMLGTLIAIFEVNYPDGFYKVNPIGTTDMQGIYSSEIVKWLRTIKQRMEE